ncbi:MAG: heme-copper oxidase subunit III [Anaerolineaceae bacterium]|nr:heme-copper oxidase subunit III [Anaerolineaceae bacterium]
MQQDLSQHLSRKELQDLKNKRTGLAIFQFSWIMAFVALIAANWQLRYQFTTWPPPGVEKFGIGIPTLVTLLLIVSSLLVRSATRAVKRGDHGIFESRWGLSLILGVIFVVVMAWEWVIVPVSGQYSNLFRLMVGFHGVHALVIGAFMVVVYRNGRAGAYDEYHFWPVEGAAGLWHFVTVAWVLFYLVLYLV